MERVPQSSLVSVAMKVGHTHPMERDTNFSSFPLNNRSVKSIPEDSTTSEAQTKVPLNDPEKAGLPTGEGSVHYGRVTTSCSLLSAFTATAALGLKTCHQIQYWGQGEGSVTFIEHLLCAK